MKSSFTVLGGMAGSSMDGLDLALVRFEKNGDWHYEVLRCITLTYPSEVYEMLKASKTKTMEELADSDIAFGQWIGKEIHAFLNGEHAELLAIHGHTAIHRPEEGISLQLGNGAVIAQITGIPTITAFRSQDVSLGGQGAPLVPFGDFQLFREYDVCLNLGGIANLSLKDRQLAWDICPCNQVLNYFARQLGQDYDEGGQLGKKGQLDHSFLDRISTLSYFSAPPPKSLPNEFLSASLLGETKPLDGLRSYSYFIANQIAHDLEELQSKKSKMLVTGGGAFNDFLVSQIRDALPDWEVIIPDQTTISFKEAIVFAFLGLMRHLNKTNVLSSVTGSSKDTSSGVIHLPK